jgi:hypothetical protein
MRTKRVSLLTLDSKTPDGTKTGIGRLSTSMVSVIWTTGTDARHRGSLRPAPRRKLRRSDPFGDSLRGPARGARALRVRPACSVEKPHGRACSTVGMRHKVQPCSGLRRRHSQAP